MDEWPHFERLPEENEVVYRTADGELTWLETQRLSGVVECFEMEEQRGMEAEARLVAMEAYWKFLRWLFDHGRFDDDRLEPAGDDKYDLP